jgi:hypothetical protein
MKFDNDPMKAVYMKAPKERLYQQVKKYGIPIDKSITNWITDKRYKSYDPVDDYFDIKDAIDIIVASKRLDEVPPPIIAIMSLAHGYPIVYFIKKSVFINSYRKKKSSKTKTKRKSKKCGCK